MTIRARLFRLLACVRLAWFCFWSGMVTRKQDHIYMVINAGCKDKDLKHLGAKLKEFNEKNKADVRIEELHKEWSEHNNANHAHAHAPRAPSALCITIPRCMR